jgi:NADPH:quinone reductase-like Zn-dependent oxidoreductase
MADTMRAIVARRYGGADTVELRDLELPVASDNQMLVRVRAASVNPYDWHRLTGTPILLLRRRYGWLRPKREQLGSDYAGVVETVGRDVTGYRPGDEVYGCTHGAFAEYVVAREGGSVASKPAGLTFEEAAAVPLAALTALQGLRDHGRLQAGHQVLINGAAGGVGTFAVQIAKAFGAEVTAVCSTRNTGLVASLGADHVIDYTRDDFTRTGRHYDLLLDNIGNRSWSQYCRVLQPEAILVMAGGPKTNLLIGPRWYHTRVRLAARSDSRTFLQFRAQMTNEDLRVMTGMLEAGDVKPVIDRTYRLEETAQALRYLGQWHVAGKLVIIP